MQFTCARCGMVHDVDEMAFGTDAPLHWECLSAADRAQSQLGEEQCIINSEGQRHFYVRAVLEVPIQGSERPFNWGVWVSLSEQSYREMSEHWQDPSRTSLGPYFGWLCTKIPEYPDTLLLKTHLHQRPIGERPAVELEPTDHPLSVDQRQGIDEKRVEEIVVRLLHP
jgi:hypothetical protein